MARVVVTGGAGSSGGLVLMSWNLMVGMWSSSIRCLRGRKVGRCSFRSI